jgi:hypothetical protein
MASYAKDGVQLILDFAINTVKMEDFPKFDIALDLLKEQFLKTSNLLPVQCQRIEAEIKQKIKEAHRRAPPVIKTFLEPMYAQCADERGKEESLAFQIFVY